MTAALPAGAAPVPAARAAARAAALLRAAGPPRLSWAVAAATLCVCVPSGGGGGDGVQVTAADVAGAAVVALAALAAWLRGARVPRALPLAFAPLLVALTASTVCSQDVAASLPGYVRVVQIFVLVPVAVVLAVRDRDDLAVVLGAVVAVGTFEAGFGAWQAATGTGASIGGRTVRAVGTFGATDVMAMATVAGFATIVAAAVAAARPGRARAAACAVLAVLGAGLLLALSRGSWIAVGAGVLIVLTLSDPRAALRTVLCAGAAATVLVGGFGLGSDGLKDRTLSIASSVDAPDRSVSDRYDLWGTAVAIWRDHPVTGVGVKNFPEFRDTYAPLGLSGASETDDPTHGYRRQPLLSPHNEYLLVLSEQGVLGLAGFLLLFGALVRGLALRRDRTDPAWLLGAGLLGSLAINFWYADLGGPTCTLTAVMIGAVAARALRADLAPGAAGTAGAPAAAA
ncbi:O-antigen ligase family protein [Actinomadura parmotrematis]|uniref:O-antigen ligase family protein n=1 Tax=Actinomadura parmotrematis TaxID=2864039 RepID=A0ABS7G2Y1_9ACTN|nr:O-antigen ligase family protein [Actinomadura parmotrematis]MBW8486901.1 O-antigen ligase family protein [Actinomadura parmotrematis]